MIFSIQARIPEKLSQLDKIVRDEVLAHVTAATKDITEKAARNLSGGILRRRSGAGLASLESKVVGTANKIEGRVGSKKFYLRMLETGIQPHPISLKRFRGRGRNRRPIRRGPRGMPVGSGLFRTKVMHPGVPARPWLSSVGKEYEAGAGRVLARRIEQAIAKPGPVREVRA